MENSMDKQEVFDSVMNDIYTHRKIGWSHINKLEQLGIPAVKVHSYTVAIDDFIDEVCRIWRKKRLNKY